MAGQANANLPLLAVSLVFTTYSPDVKGVSALVAGSATAVFLGRLHAAQGFHGK